MREVFDEFVTTNEYNCKCIKWALTEGRIACLTVFCLGGEFNQKTFVLRNASDLKDIVEPIMTVYPYWFSIYDKEGNCLHSEKKPMGRVCFLEDPTDQYLLQKSDEAIEKIKAYIKEDAHQAMLAKRRARRAQGKKKKV